MESNSSDPPFKILCIDGLVHFASNKQEVYAEIVIVIINIVISLLGTVCNGLVIMAYHHNPRLQTIQNTIFFFLATTDISVTLFVQPVYVIAVLRGLLGKRDCLVWDINVVSSWLFLGLSLFTIAILTLQSYITLAYPYRFQNIITKNRLKKAVAISWLFIGILTVNSSIFSRVSFADYVCLILILVTVIFVISTWIWTYKLVARHRRFIETNQTPATQNFMTRKLILRSTVTAFFVTLSLFGCYCLALLLTFQRLLAWSIGHHAYLILVGVSWTMMYFNSLLNPCLVFWRSSNFRETTKNILTGGDILP